MPARRHQPKVLRIVSRGVSGIVTQLEMTSPTQLVPGQPPPDPLELVEIGPDSASLVRTIYLRIWEPLGSGGRIAWSDERWAVELAAPGVRTWVARMNGADAGFVELAAELSGDVGIVVFGLVPEFQSQGFGAAFLTLATETAWSIGSPTGTPTRRVWLQTSSADHPNALPNYKRRGFQVFKSGPAAWRQESGDGVVEVVGPPLDRPAAPDHQ